MGIQKQFHYGIKLHTFSFAFSNLKRQEVEEPEENDSESTDHKFLGAFSKEMFSEKKWLSKKAMKVGWNFLV